MLLLLLLLRSSKLVLGPFAFLVLCRTPSFPCPHSYLMHHASTAVEGARPALHLRRTAGLRDGRGLVAQPPSRLRVRRSGRCSADAPRASRPAAAGSHARACNCCWRRRQRWWRRFPPSLFARRRAPRSRRRHWRSAHLDSECRVCCSGWPWRRRCTRCFALVAPGVNLDAQRVSFRESRFLACIAGIELQVSLCSSGVTSPTVSQRCH